MKRYLDLIPISAKRHRRQSLMTRLCIFLAVFLVTAIFGMADMELRSQRQQAHCFLGHHRRTSRAHCRLARGENIFLVWRCEL